MTWDFHSIAELPKGAEKLLSDTPCTLRYRGSDIWQVEIFTEDQPHRGAHYAARGAVTSRLGYQLTWDSERFPVEKNK